MSTVSSCLLNQVGFFRIMFASSFSKFFMQHYNCRDEGGMLHIHGNVKDTEEGIWTNHILQSISEIAKSEGILSLTKAVNFSQPT